MRLNIPEKAGLLGAVAILAIAAMAPRMAPAPEPFRFEVYENERAVAAYLRQSEVQPGLAADGRAIPNLDALIQRSMVLYAIEATAGKGQ
jgi:hypothetical protein